MKAVAFFLGCLCSGVVYALYTDHERAAAYHGQAMELVNQNRYDEGLAHFRAACRWNNESALYWNDLGVTEMRMGQYQLAKKRLLKALWIDPEFKLALQNMNDLEFFNPHDDSSVHRTPYVGEDRRHKIMQLRELSRAEFDQLNSAFSNYAQSPEHHEFVKSALSAPFILKNAFDLLQVNEDKLEAVLNRRFLTTKYGHHRADFYPHNMLAESAHPFFLNLGSALQQLLYKPEEAYVGVDASEPGTYVQWNLDHALWGEVLGELGVTLPSMLNDTTSWVRGCFGVDSVSSVSSVSSGNFDSSDDVYEEDFVDTSVDGDSVHTTKPHTNTHPTTTTLDTTLLSQFYLSTHWQMLLLAESNAGMFLHKDTLRTDSWQVQLVGRKKWHLCSDTNTPYLYKAGEVDMFSVDYNVHPLVRHAKCYEVTLQPGELLYYPADTWHQTVNLDTPSISISSTLVTPANHEHVIEELRKECADNGLQRIFAYDERMCGALEKCYTLWSELYA